MHRRWWRYRARPNDVWSHALRCSFWASRFFPAGGYTRCNRYLLASLTFWPLSVEESGVALGTPPRERSRGRDRSLTGRAAEHADQLRAGPTPTSSIGRTLGGGL